MADVEQRVAAVEARVESAFALDARLKAIEGDVRKLKSSSLRDWLQTLGPYVAGLIVLLVGYWIKDSVTLALQREQLDLEYVKNMRDLVADFRNAHTPEMADANAIGLAMYGQHAILPLVERVQGGDVGSIAAELGLRIVGAEHPAASCPKFASVVNDRGRRFRWNAHKALIKVMGQSGCVEYRGDLLTYRAALAQVGSDERSLQEFAKRRYSETAGFDASSVAGLIEQIDEAVEILTPQVEI